MDEFPRTPLRAGDDDAAPPSLREALRRFREACAEDAAAGRVLPVEAYLARFPGHEDSVREWHAKLREDGDGLPVVPPPTATVLRRLLSPDGARFRDAGEIARGGMGAILRVHDETLGRPLAMKVLLGEEGRLSGDLGEEAPTLAPSPSLRRFLQEAHVTAQLAHPGVPPVHALGVDPEGRVFFTMKLVRGGTLSQVFTLVQEGTQGWTVTRALQVFLRICETVAFAHSRGVIHRDLKPPNIMVGDFGEVYVMDWGLAKTLGLREAEARSGGIARDDGGETSGARDLDGLTLAGSVLGTPYYMSPEQAAGHHDRLDRRSDVYSIGAMLFELLAGVPPYRDPSEPTPHPLVVVAAVREGPPRPLHEIRRRVPAELEAIVARAMARRPEDRYPSAAELAEDLHRYLDGHVVRAHRGGPLVELTKWVRRHRGEAAGAFAVVALTVLGAVILAARERSAAVDLAAERDAAVAARRAAEQERRRAQGSTLCARSFTQLARDPSLALQLAVAGAEWAPGGEANEALLAALHGHREARRLYGHDTYVYGVRWSPDGSGLLSWQWGRLVILWDPVAGTERHRLDAHDDLVTDAAWSPDGRTVVTCSMDGRPRLWDAATGACLRVLEGHAGPVVRAAFDATGARLLTASDDGTARLWDAAGGACLRVLRGHGAGVRSAVFHPDGRRALTAGADRTARLWDLDAATEVRRVDTSEVPPGEGPPYEPSAGRSPTWSDVALFAAGGDVFVTWHRIASDKGNHGELRLHETGTGAEIARAGAPKAWVRRPLVLGDGALLAVADSGDGPTETTVRDARTFAVVRRVKGTYGAQDFVATADGRVLAGAGLWDAAVTLVRTEPSHKTVSLPHSYSAMGMDFHPDGTRLATAACDRTVRIWWTAAPDVFAGVDGLPVWPLADGTRAWLTTADEGGRIRSVAGLDARTGAETWRRDDLPDVRHATEDHARTRVVLSGDSCLLVLDGITGAEVARIEGEEWRAARWTPRMSVGPSARRIALWRDESVAIFDVERRALLTDGVIAQGLGYYRADWDGTGDRIAFSHGSLRLHTVWETATGRELCRLTGHTGHAIDVALSPDGRRVATTAVDRSVRVWDVETARPLAANRTIPMEECSVTFHPGGALLSLSGRQAGVLVLSAATLEPVARISPELAERGWTWFDPSGASFLTRGGSGAIRRWPLDALSTARERLPCAMEPAVWRQIGFGTPAEFEAAEEAWLRVHREPERLARRGIDRIDAGDLPGARRWIDEALAVRRRHALPHHALACWHAARGDLSAALDALEEAARHEGALPQALEADPRLVALRGEPRFRALVERTSAERR